MVHVGMPKTGTSSIQGALAAGAGPGVHVAQLQGPNHSGSMVLLFDRPDRLAEYHGFWPRGADYLATLPQRREELRASFDAQLDRAARDGLDVVISAESLWNIKRDDVRLGLRQALSRHGAEVEVIGYLRPPLSYAASAFQQRLKGPTGPGPLNLKALLPGYARGLRAMDLAFGPDRVRWRLYRRDALRSGDVIEDFAAATGLALAELGVEAHRLNESLPAEAAAFLYAQRRRGLALPSGFRQAPARTRKLIAGLRRLGHRRLAFAGPLASAALAEHIDEVGLAEERLGQPLRDQDAGDAVLIRSEADLLALGDEVAGHQAAREFLDGVEAAGALAGPGSRPGRIGRAAPAARA